jgi:hypothetical protein
MVYFVLNNVIAGISFVAPIAAKSHRNCFIVKGVAE